MLLFIKDSNLPRAKFSPGLSATLLQRTVLLNLGHVPLKYTVNGQRNGKFSHSWEDFFFFSGGKASSLCLDIFGCFFEELLVIFTRRKKKKGQQDPKDGNSEEGGMLGWCLEEEAQLLLHRLCLHCY